MNAQMAGHVGLDVRDCVSVFDIFYQDVNAYSFAKVPRNRFLEALQCILRDEAQINHYATIWHDCMRASRTDKLL